MSTEQYLVSAKVKELAASLRASGWTVETESHFHDVLYNIVATKGTAIVVMDVKAGSSLSDLQQQLALHRDHAHKHGASFRLVVVNPPHKIEVDIEDFESALTDYLMNNIPSELDALSSNTRIEYVSDVEYDLVSISRGGVHVAGTASVSVELEFGGGESRDGFVSTDSFPLEFDLVLDRELNVGDVNSLDIDTSSWYE